MSDGANGVSSGRAGILLTGLLGIGLVITLSALVIALFGSHLTDWVAIAFMSAIPTQIVVSLVWNNAQPMFVRELRQPLRGVALTTMVAAAGATIFSLAFVLVGKGHGPTPMLIHFMIMTVVAALWLVLIWQCWPFTLLARGSVASGLLTLAGCYALAYILWSMFFNYSGLSRIHHPLYRADVDPAGLFDMWTALVFALTTGAIIIALGLFDSWPIDRSPGGARQPMRGLVGTAYVLIGAAAVRWLFVDAIGMDQVDYMVRGPVCVAFGVLLVSNMMQFAIFPAIPQPRRGLALLALAAGVAILCHWLYGLASAAFNGEDLGTGPSGGFAREIWIASAMLGVTFPIIFVVSGFFDFWPVKRS